MPAAASFHKIQDFFLFQQQVCGDLLLDYVSWWWICLNWYLRPPSRATVLHLRLPTDQRCSTAPWAAGMEVNWRKTEGTSLDMNKKSGLQNTS